MLVEELPLARRQVVTLRDVEGLPSADVCSILGISEGNQRVLLHRALIEAHLGECEGCAEHLRQIRITVAVMGGIGEEDLDPAAREDLMEIYRRWRRDRPA